MRWVGQPAHLYTKEHEVARTWRCRQPKKSKTTEHAMRRNRAQGVTKKSVHPSPRCAHYALVQGTVSITRIELSATCALRVVLPVREEANERVIGAASGGVVG